MTGVLALPVRAETWADLMMAAWQQEPETHAWQAQAQVLEAMAADARRWWPAAPTLSVSHRNDQWHANEGVSEWEAELEAPVWNNGQRESQMAVASANEAEWQAQQAALRLKLAGGVREAVWNLAERSAQRELARAQWATATTLEKDVLRRVAVGDLAQSDALLAQSETLAAQNTLTESEGQWLRAQQALELLTGHRQLPSPLSETRPALELNDEVIERHPLVVAARQQWAMSQAEMELSRSSKPSLSAALLWAQTHETLDDNNKQNIGLRITLPLGADARQQSTVAQAQRNRALLFAQLEKTRRATRQQIVAAQAVFDNANSQRQQAEQQNRLAQQSLTLSRRAFDVGELDLLSLLRLQQIAQQAQAQQEARRIASDRAIAELNQAWGVLP